MSIAESGTDSTAAISNQPEGQSDSPAQAYFDQALAAFERAETAVGSADWFFRLGSHHIRIRFAGEAMLPHLTQAFTHLAAEAQPDPALTILVWDTASTGVSMPARVWRPEDHLPRGQIRDFDTQRIQAANLPVMDGFSILDHTRHLAIHWDSDADKITHHERSFPLRVIINWWASRHDLQFAHAGAVGLPDCGGLIAGKSGSGKSTTALACLNSDLMYASDDHVLLSLESRPFVHSIYNSAKLEADHIQRFPHLLPLVSNANKLDTEKALLFVQEAYPGKVSHGFPVSSILVPRVTGRRETTLRPISAADGLAALAPSSMFLLPGDDHQSFRNLARISRSVPSFALELGSDLSQIPDVILNHLANM